MNYQPLSLCVFFVTVKQNFNGDRVAGAVLIAPVVNYWWAGLPRNLTNELFYLQKLQDQWALRVAHYIPWLTYWWNTQTWFPSSSLIADSLDLLSLQDRELLPKRKDRKNHLVYGLYDETHLTSHFIFVVD